MKTLILLTVLVLTPMHAGIHLRGTIISVQGDKLVINLDFTTDADFHGTERLARRTYKVGAAIPVTLNGVASTLEEAATPGRVALLNLSGRRIKFVDIVDGQAVPQPVAPAEVDAANAVHVLSLANAIGAEDLGLRLAVVDGTVVVGHFKATRQAGACDVSALTYRDGHFHGALSGRLPGAKKGPPAADFTLTLYGSTFTGSIGTETVSGTLTQGAIRARCPAPTPGRIVLRGKGSSHYFLDLVVQGDQITARKRNRYGQGPSPVDADLRYVDARLSGTIGLLRIEAVFMNGVFLGMARDGNDRLQQMTGGLMPIDAALTYHEVADLALRKKR